MRTTHTRTHVHVIFANPFLVCDICGGRTPRWHDPERCGCGDPGWENLPCGHQAGIHSSCPSWGPVDGCTCAAYFGSVRHGPPLR